MQPVLYDLTVLVILILLTIRGYQKGLIHQIGSVVAMIIGILVSVRYTPALAHNLTSQIPFFTENSSGSSVCSFVLLMIFSTLIVWGIINFVSGIINRLKLNSWNNHMGALLGLLHGFIWVLVLTFLLWVYAVPLEKQALATTGEPQSPPPTTSPAKKSFILQSKLGPYLTEVVLSIIDILPQPQPTSNQLYVRLREYVSTSAQTVKDSNPELKSFSNRYKTSTPTTTPGTPTNMPSTPANPGT